MATRNVRRKLEVRAFLGRADRAGLLGWADSEGHRTALRTLQSLLFDSEEAIRWRAADGLGRVAARVAEEDLDRVRVVLRGLFWSMNDESGNLIRFAPQAIGEILFHVPELLPEYELKLAAFREEPPFEEGVRWALEHLGGAMTGDSRAAASG